MTAGAARAREQIGEVRMQDIGIQTDRLENVAKDLRDTDFQINEALPKLKALKDQLAETQIRAPATGKVVGLTVFTVGGVVAPGQKLLDIVPDAAPLVINAQVSPKDAADLYPGQRTQIRISSLHDRELPILEGEITRVSADSFIDEKTGQSFFTAEVVVPETEIAKIMKVRKTTGLKPGVPVQVLVPLKKRTALEYMFEPLTHSLWKSFREH
jgi:HlyD family secretion protein